MLHALTLLAAETPEKSKVAFYVCGGLLVAYAIGLTGLGMSSVDFPGTAVARRGLMALGAILVAAAMVTAVATA
jgi:hypothetical protein